MIRSNKYSGRYSIYTKCYLVTSRVTLLFSGIPKYLKYIDKSKNKKRYLTSSLINFFSKRLTKHYLPLKQSTWNLHTRSYRKTQGSVSKGRSVYVQRRTLYSEGRFSVSWWTPLTYLRKLSGRSSWRRGLLLAWTPGNPLSLGFMRGNGLSEYTSTATVQSPLAGVYHVRTPTRPGKHERALCLVLC